MYIKDKYSGTVRKYGTNHHDSLRISNDGRTLSYENLQNGDGSRYGDYRFVTDKEGHIPAEDEDLIKYGAGAYFNIGGFKLEEVLEEINTELAKKCEEQGDDEYDNGVIMGLELAIEIIDKHIKELKDED